MQILNKTNLRKIGTALIIGLGVLLVVLALGIRAASQEHFQPAAPGSGSNISESSPEAPTPTPVVSPVPTATPAETAQDGDFIRYIINKGSGDPASYKAVLATGKETVFDMLKSLSGEKNFGLEYKYKYPQFGVFIESIAGIKNGTNGKYWQYYINDKLGEVAADKKQLKAGDKVEWRFEKVP